MTDAAIAKAKREVWTAGDRREVCDSVLPGLRIRLTPPSRRAKEGRVEFVLCCRDGEGRMRRFPIGPYGSGQGELGIGRARESAKALYLQVRQQGADPIQERRAMRQLGAAARAGLGTLSALLDDYEKKSDPGKRNGAPGTKLKSWPAGRKRVENVFGPLLQRPLAVLTARDFNSTAAHYPFPQSASFAVRTLRPVLKWASKEHGVAKGVAEIEAPAPQKTRERVLSENELGDILRALSRSTRPYAAALRFMMLTLARRDEVARARWGDVDVAGGVWTIKDTKNGKPHLVPLSLQAQVLIQAQSPKDEKGTTRSPNPLSLIFTTSKGGKLLNFDRETKAIMVDSGTTGWTRHDLRRTGATMLGELGEAPEIIESALNHTFVHSKIASIYNKSRYRTEVAEALRRLADVIDEIEGGGRNVVQRHQEARFKRFEPPAQRPKKPKHAGQTNPQVVVPDSGEDLEHAE